MSALPVSRYAEDFLQAFSADWQRFEQALADSQDLRDYLAAPEHSLDEKKQLLRQVFEGLLDSFTISLLGLLLEREQLAVADQIGAVSGELLRRWRDMLAVSITTAVPLPAEEETALLAMLKERYGKEILLEKSVDESLIGGAVLKIADKLFDGSVKSRLTALEKELLK